MAKYEEEELRELNDKCAETMRAIEGELSRRPWLKEFFSNNEMVEWLSFPDSGIKLRAYNLYGKEPHVVPTGEIPFRKGVLVLECDTTVPFRIQYRMEGIDTTIGIEEFPLEVRNEAIGLIRLYVYDAWHSLTEFDRKEIKKAKLKRRQEMERRLVAWMQEDKKYGHKKAVLLASLK